MTSRGFFLAGHDLNHLVLILFFGVEKAFQTLKVPPSPISHRTKKTTTWNSKQPGLYGWTKSYYIINGCFTKHLLKDGLLRVPGTTRYMEDLVLQVDHTVRIRSMCKGCIRHPVLTWRRPGPAKFHCFTVEIPSQKMRIKKIIYPPVVTQIFEKPPQYIHVFLNSPWYLQDFSGGSFMVGQKQLNCQGEASALTWTTILVEPKFEFQNKNTGLN